MKDMALWNEGDWIAVIGLFVLAVFLAVGAKVAVQKEPEFAGHPKGLYMLFFAEMWERFSYYGMRALLIFYLTQHWLFNDSKSNLIYGAYTSLVYITPVLGLARRAGPHPAQRRDVRPARAPVRLLHLRHAHLPERQRRPRRPRRRGPAAGGGDRHG